MLFGGWATAAQVISCRRMAVPYHRAAFEVLRRTLLPSRRDARAVVA